MLKPENIQTILCGDYQENAYLVCPDGREDAFLVDPGDDLPALERALARSGRRLAAILLTHGHFDHTLAAQPLADATGAAVYIHSNDAEMLNDSALNAYAPDVSALNAYAPDVSALPPLSGLGYTCYGDSVTVCGETLEVLHTPGHSAGSVCLRSGDILFCGDTLFCAGYGRTDLYGGSNLQMRRTLRMLLQLPPETRAYCGHGPATTIGAERTRYRL